MSIDLRDYMPAGWTARQPPAPTSARVTCWDDPAACMAAGGCPYCDEGSILTPMQAHRLTTGRPAGDPLPTVAEGKALAEGRAL